MQYLRSAEDASEIVNDTFMAVWEKRDELEIGENLKPLLYTIARNKSINLIKKKKPDFTDLENAPDPGSREFSPLENLMAKETELRIFALIDALPPRCRQIFVLSRREQLSNREIAGIMELSEKTVENQISIAIKLIRAGLRRGEGGGLQGLILLPWLLSGLSV